MDVKEPPLMGRVLDVKAVSPRGLLPQVPSLGVDCSPQREGLRDTC